MAQESFISSIALFANLTGEVAGSYGGSDTTGLFALKNSKKEKGKIMAFDYDNWTYVPENSEDGHEYTYQEVLEIARGNEVLAKMIVDLCDWQHPETILDEMEREGEIVEVNGKYIVVSYFER